MLIRKIVTGCVLLYCGTAANAQGFFDFGDIPGVDKQPIVDVNLSSVIIGFIAGMAREADPSAADMLSGLRGVRLQVFDTIDNPKQLSNFIDDVTKKLEGEGWQRVVFVQDDDARVRIHLQMTAEEVSGMTVMLFDNKEAVFINIAGRVSAADLGKVLAALPGTDVLSSLPFPPGALAPPQGR